MKNTYWRVAFFCSLLILICYGCKGILDGFLAETNLLRQQSIAAMDKAINEMESAPSEYARILNDLKDELVEEVREEVITVIETATAEAQSSILCVIDAIPNRVLRNLRRIRHEFILGNQETFQERITPVICQVVKSTIDLTKNPDTRKKIAFYGYDFLHRDSFAVYFVNANASTQIENIFFQSNYESIVDLSDLSDDFLSQYNYLALRYNDIELSTIPIQHDNRPPETKTVYITPSRFGYLAPWTYGDREFKGHGPNVVVHCKLRYNSKQVFLDVDFQAKETKRDWTTAEGNTRHYFYTAPHGWSITGIEGQTVFDNIVKYLDDDTTPEVFSTTLGQFTIVGDTRGNDAGVDTGIESILFTYEVPIKLQKDN